jgi:hypothetical protein
MKSGGVASSGDGRVRASAPAAAGARARRLLSRRALFCKLSRWICPELTPLFRLVRDSSLACPAGPALANLVEEATAAVKATRATGAAPRAADAELLSRRVGRLTAVLGQRFGCTLFQSWGTSACDAACF